MHPAQVHGTDPQVRSAPALRQAYGLLLLLAGAVVALDQLLKAMVTSRFSNGGYLDLLRGLVRVDYTRNSGAAFGFLPNGGFLFAGIAVAVILAILLAYRRLAAAPLVVRGALGLVLGGALGNLIDRVRLGYVVDFIDLRWWPVFNAADSAIVVGVILLLLYSVASSDRTGER